jgi:type II secretion system protein L
MTAARIIPLSQLAQAKDTRNAVISVPGERVSALSCTVPANLRGKNARNVALQAVQEMLAAPTEDTSLVVLPGAGASRTVLVSTRADQESWTAQKAQHKLRSARVLPDYLCLPWQPGTLTISAPSPDRLVVRSSETNGFAGETAMVLTMLQQLRAQQIEGLSTISLVPETAQEDAALMAELSAWGLPIHPTDQAANPPQASVLAGTGTDMGLSPRARSVAKLVAVGAVALLFWSLNSLSDIRELERQTTRQRQANSDFVRQELGLTGPIVDLRVQVDRALAERRTALATDDAKPSLPDYLATAGPVLAAPDIAVSQFRCAANELTISVEVQDFARLEALRTTLQTTGLTVQVLRSVGSGTEGVRADLRISHAKGARQ